MQKRSLALAVLLVLALLLAWLDSTLPPERTQEPRPHAANLTLSSSKSHFPAPPQLHLHLPKKNPTAAAESTATTIEFTLFTVLPDFTALADSTAVMGSSWDQQR